MNVFQSRPFEFVTRVVEELSSMGTDSLTPWPWYTGSDLCEASHPSDCTYCELSEVGNNGRGEKVDEGDVSLE